VDREESPCLHVVRLKVDAVMCQIGTCINEAAFLVRQDGVESVQCARSISQWQESPMQMLQRLPRII